MKKIFNFITELKTQLKDRSKNNIIIILDELNQFLIQMKVFLLIGIIGRQYL